MSKQERNSNSAAVLLALINWAAFYRVDEAQRRNQHGKKQQRGAGTPASLELTNFMPAWTCKPFDSDVLQVRISYPNRKTPILRRPKSSDCRKDEEGVFLLSENWVASKNTQKCESA